MNEQNAQRKEKPLEEIIYRSLKTLSKRYVGLNSEKIKELKNIGADNPALIKEYFRQGIELAYVKNGGLLTEDYLESAIDVMKLKPECLQEFYESTSRLLESTEVFGKKGLEIYGMYEIFYITSRFIINSPKSFQKYIDLGMKYIEMDRTGGMIAEIFLGQSIKLATLKPHWMDILYDYSIKVLQIGDKNNVREFVEIPDIILKYPDHARNCMKNYLRILKEKNKRQKNLNINISPESSYLYGLRHLLTAAPNMLPVYTEEGIKLLKNQKISPRVSEGFFWDGPLVIINSPGRLKEYIDTGIKLAKEIQKDDYGSWSISDYFSLAYSLTTKPRRFRKEVNEKISLYKNPKNRGKLTSMDITAYVWKFDINKEDIREEWINDSEVYRTYSKYSKRIYNIDKDLGKLFLNIHKDILINDINTYTDFANIGWLIARKSFRAAKKYLEYVSNVNIHPETLDEVVKKINQSKEIVCKSPTQYIKPSSNQLRIGPKELQDSYGTIIKQAYDITVALIKKLGKNTLTKTDIATLNNLPLEFIEKIVQENKQINDRNQYPNINLLLKKEKPFPSREDMHITDADTAEQSKIKRAERHMMKQCFEELRHYFEKILKIGDDSIRTINKLQRMYYTEFDANNIIFEFNKKRLDDFFSDRTDCISYKGKYSEESKNFLLNQYSTILNINAYHKSKNVKRKLIQNLGKIITCVAEVDNKKLWYIAGLSADEQLDFIQGWEKKAYDTILKTAKLNSDKIDGVLFDLNPRNREHLSHEWAEYTAKQTGLIEDKDYIYQKKNFSTAEFQTNDEEKIFELINPEWKEIKILRDEGLEGKFFLEGVMQEPKNKEIGHGIKPDLVYDKGYVIGKYVDIKNL